MVLSLFEQDRGGPFRQCIYLLHTGIQTDKVPLSFNLINTRIILSKNILYTGSNL